MSPTRLLLVFALVGGLAHHGVLPIPKPVREAMRSAEDWRDERVAVLRCRAAVVAALASADDEQALQRVEAVCVELRAQSEAAHELLERDSGL